VGADGGAPDPGAQVAAGADVPALLVAGPDDAVAAAGGHLSPFTKMWLLALVVGLVAIAIAVMTAWYWRRTSPAVLLARWHAVADEPVAGDDRDTTMAWDGAHAD